MLRVLASFIFNFIKIAKKVISVLLLLFFIWFGYNFYLVFSESVERGNNEEVAAVEAFNKTLSKTTSLFEKIPKSIDIQNPFTNPYAEKENIREIFIETRGVPEAYMIIISYDEIKEGVPIKRENPLRFETWFYKEPYNSKVIFENGFFKGEKNIGETEGLEENSASPLAFDKKTSKSEIQNIFGKESCILTERAGADVLTTYRFKETNNTPLAAVTFVNERLISATVGIVFLSDNEQELCK